MSRHKEAAKRPPREDPANQLAELERLREQPAALVPNPPPAPVPAEHADWLKAEVLRSMPKSTKAAYTSALSRSVPRPRQWLV